MKFEKEQSLWGYPSVESLIFGFIKVSQLVPKESTLYSDVKQLSDGRRRLFNLSHLDDSSSMKAHGLSGVLTQLEKKLGEEWASPEIAFAIRERLGKIMADYVGFYVLEISAAVLKKDQVVSNLRCFYFAQRIAVTLAWLEQRWGIGFLGKFASEPAKSNLVGRCLRWIRRLEGLDVQRAAMKVGITEFDEFGKQMYRWESGRHAPRRDSYPQIRQAYGLDQNPIYGLWFWIAIVLDNCDSAFKKEIAAGVGKGFDKDAARETFISMSNQAILDREVPQCYLILNRLLCTQASREDGDYELALKCLQEFEEHVDAHDGCGKYHLYSFQARMAVFTGRPKIARDLFMKAIELARYSEHTAAEKFLRAFAALCAYEKFVVPLKDVTDKQWLFGMHPVQKRKPDMWTDETEEMVTSGKRAFDYFRYFPPQSFFGKQRVVVLTQKL
ncbi:helix-turn-helix domain-containing protein [Herbaspirillum autotrophicum]|uniref:helix-turn-helix transcriptional regulator n=1 Tax=Herbaspirillum autotrophicum TaxID=180195 RepID=UPI00067AC80B|nr:helix-turn-helix transcriptional regulator [Herbaspirillum autotrophicum]